MKESRCYKGRIPRQVWEHERLPICHAILEAVCETYWVSRQELFSRDRPARVVWARHVAMYLVSGFTKLDEKQIAQLFRRRSACTITHAIKKVKDEVAINKRRREELETIEQKLETP